MDPSDAICDQVAIPSKVEGFFEASVTFALLRLDLFESLGQREASIHQLSHKPGAGSGRLGRLLRCAATMGLLECRDVENFTLSKPARVVLMGHQASRELMSRLFPRVKPGGSLVVQAQFLGSGGLGHRWPAILDLIMLCVSQHGENHTVEETCLWLREAGFGEAEHRPLFLLNTNSYVRAHKPVRSHQ